MGTPAYRCRFLPTFWKIWLGAGASLHVAGLQELPRLLAAPMQPEDLRRKWLTSPAVGLFETGRCAEQEFAAAFIEEWGLELGRDEFLEEFRSWVRAPYAGHEFQ